ncbi:MAG TPA: LD-carboxypeptidase [Thermoanaerobaculia bacterium]|nr:LD-carboxypeptidase [Thermoanaerobaculia bacterium]
MMNRRAFAKLSSLALLAAPAAHTIGQTSVKSVRSAPLRPRKLSPGDTVGMVLPASMSFEADEIALARETLEALGMKVVLGKHAYDRYGYLAGKDRDRAADINAMFASPDIDGIFAFSGGWGAPRVLPYIDYELIRRNPKVFIGFSDITALLTAINQKTGLVTFHGPVAHSSFEPFTLESFKRVVMSSQSIGTLSNPPKPEEQLVRRDYRIVTLTGGKATGTIVGGNLSLIAATMGTPYEIETEGSIFFIEDVREELYRVDRMLTQLWLAGKFDRVKGLVFGRCTDCPVKGPSLSLEEILRERFLPSGVPAISGFAFGHIEKKLTIPIGMQATLDADAGTLEIAMSAVTD